MSTTRDTAPLDSTSLDSGTLAGIRRIADLARERGIAIFTHARPDGDAAGSAAALARAMKALGARAEVVFVGPVPRWTADVMGSTPWRELPSNTPFGGDPALDNSAVAIVDTGSWSQLTELKPWLQARRERTLMVDHHLHTDPDVGAVRVVDPGAASATQVVARIVVALLNLDSPSKLPAAIAEPLYLGLATDTGWFRHSNTTSAVLVLGADLLDAGAVPAKLYELIEQRDDPSRLRLLSRALASLRIERAGRLAVMSLTLRDFELAGARRTESGGFIDHAMTLDGVEVAAILTEEPPQAGAPIVKISLRSKAFAARPGFMPVDVNVVCRTFGGGGHARAAGAKLEGALDGAIVRLLAAIPE